ncbi:hypothetical protein KIF59_07085 [Enterobacter cloacae subsp. cloacae]|nr:hypothetical protein [Enterobacter cloacae subsp. cloacae]
MTAMMRAGPKSTASAATSFCVISCAADPGANTKSVIAEWVRPDALIRPSPCARGRTKKSRR